MLTLAIFVSGRGSNFTAIHSSIERGELDARIGVLVASKADAGAVGIAHSLGIPVHVAVGENASAHALISILRTHKIDFIALCGYLKLIPPDLVQAFKNRIVNIHPALLPSFGGKGMYGHHVHEAVLSSGARLSGATVHLVSEEYDRGPIVLQRAIDVRDDDTAASLADRVLSLEHELLPAALELFAHDRIRVEGLRTIHLSEHP